MITGRLTRPEACWAAAVDCVGSSQADGRTSFVAGVDDPIQNCRQVWPEYFGTAAPAQLTACVDGSPQGSIKVYPGGRGVADMMRGAGFRDVRHLPVLGGLMSIHVATR